MKYLLFSLHSEHSAFLSFLIIVFFLDFLHSASLVRFLLRPHCVLETARSWECSDEWNYRPHAQGANTKWGNIGLQGANGESPNHSLDRDRQGVAEIILNYWFSNGEVIQGSICLETFLGVMTWGGGYYWHLIRMLWNILQYHWQFPTTKHYAAHNDSSAKSKKPFCKSSCEDWVERCLVWQKKLAVLGKIWSWRYDKLVS